MSDIARQLNTKGYQIAQIVTSENAITGIYIDDESISMNANETATIQVTYEGNPEGIEYYAVIKDKYYKMVLNDSGVEIEEKESKVQDNCSQEKLTATVTSGTDVIVEKIDRNVITLKAGNRGGTSVVTVSYGIYSKVCTVSVLIKPLDVEANSKIEINTDYGLVDVIWLSGDTNIVSQTANKPDLYTDLGADKALTPVTWTYHEKGITLNEKTVNWTKDEIAKSTWYNYSAEKGNDGKEDNTTSMWANAINTDGSYFVWIPRYAYRITYYEDASYTKVTGYYDGYGLWRASDGKKKFEIDAGIETVEHDEKKYIVHPAFMNDTAKLDSSGNLLPDYDRGGWDKDLTGIWVAKYEASRTGADAVNGGSGYSTTFKSVPNVQSAGKIIIGNMYDVSLKYDPEKKSHLLKNSEWGAVAFLTQSQYGRNGHEIDINNGSLTGNGGGSTSVTEELDTYEYNTILGAKASTTGNVYGIYDLSGGKWEHVAGYNKLGTSSRLGNASKMLSNAKDDSGNYISTKYVTAYSNGTEDKSGSSTLFEIGKVGDATKETRTTVEGINWFSDNSVFIIPNAPIFGRGGGAGEGIYDGIFYSDSTYGQSLAGVSFRLALGQ